MIPPHPVADCRPALVKLDGGPDNDEETAHTEAYNAAIQRVWAALNANARQLFHEFVCLDKKTPVHLAFMSVLEARIHRQVEEDAARHADNARKVLDAMDTLGMKTLDPQPGQEIMVVVSRVADALVLGDDPYPALAARREIVHCSRCGENCFFDPKACGQAIPLPVCIRCMDPRVSAAMDKVIADRTKGTGHD